MTENDLERVENLNSNSGRIARYIERFEQMLREQDDIAESLKELSEEAKSKGMDPATLKKAAKLRISTSTRLRYTTQTRTLFDYMESVGDPIDI